MSAADPFLAMVTGYAALLDGGAGLPPASETEASSGTPESHPSRNGRPPGTVLLFSPHPDDECITGALPLRLRREVGMRVVDVPVTLGSDRGRRAARRRELERACARLDFEIALPAADGLERIVPASRQSDPPAWAAAVDLVGAVLAAERPDVVFLPHDQDAHPTHMGTHLLVRDALLARGADGPPLAVETEFWSTMARPNLMVASGIADVADLVAALARHTGEVARNPYHLRLPAWMIDNVRRGAELIAGPRVPAPCFPFATLYRASRLAFGQLRPLGCGEIIDTGETLLGWVGRTLA